MCVHVRVHLCEWVVFCVMLQQIWLLAKMHSDTYLLENYINVRIASRNHILGKFPFDKIANIAS